MLLIVAVHTIFLVADTAPGLYKVLSVILANSSILFIFISGYLFQYLIEDYTFGSYLSKKLKNVILPYLIMSVPAIYILLTRPEWRSLSWIMTDSFLEKPVLVKILLFYVTGSHLPQFWFIPMITVFYLISPLLRYIDRNPGLYYCIPFLIVVSLVVDRPPLNDHTLQSFVYFLPVYMLGMHLSHYSKEYFSFLTKNWIYVLLVFALLSGLTFIDERVTYLQKITVTFLFMFMFSKISSKHVDFVLGLIAKYSFGIFFIHKYTIILVGFLYNKFSLAAVMNSGMTGLLVSYLIIIAVSVLLLMPVKLVFKKYSRLIIGS
jgi:surface polysaccharide O-acyltransferase-like enzyme